MLQTIPSFYAKFSEKNPFISAATYEKDFVCKDYCITHDDDKTCFLAACKNHILLHVGIEELLHKLVTFCFTHQRVDCRYTLFQYRFKRKTIAKCRKVFDNVQRAVSINQINRGVDKMPSIAIKDS